MSSSAEGQIQGGPSPQAAERGEPGYVWRSGQQRRLDMVAAQLPLRGRILDAGCGLGTWLRALEPYSADVYGIEIEHGRAATAVSRGRGIAQAAGEWLPFPDAAFDIVFSNEVLEHVADDHRCLQEIARVLRPGGHLVLFCPNRWNPVEQHGIYWRGEYRFGNKPLVNYLPDRWRDRLAPHVRAYTRRALARLLADLPLTVIHQTVIYRGWDNVVARYPGPGALFRRALYALERYPFNVIGYAHFLIARKR